MNWIKENKFLTGFLAVMLIGVGTLGYFVFSANGAYDAASASYQEQATQFNSLRRLPLYPNAKNLAIIVAQKDEAAKVVEDFQTELAMKEFPLTPMSPEQFQEKLKAAVTEVRKKAAAANVELPKEKFFLGFEIYETRPPDAVASPALGRQLKAIQWIMDQLIASPHVTSLKSLNRTPLAEEKGKVADPKAAKTAPKLGKEAKPAPRSITRNPVEVSFTCRQQTFVNILNSITGSKAPQFFIPRSIQVKNQKDRGPQKAVDLAPVAPVDPAQPGQPAKPLSTYIVGEEQIDVVLQLEIVNFSEAPAR